MRRPKHHAPPKAVQVNDRYEKSMVPGREPDSGEPRILAVLHQIAGDIRTIKNLLQQKDL